jgi:formate-dependent nitrite reductase cytochrome c552 subunit
MKLCKNNIFLLCMLIALTAGIGFVFCSHANALSTDCRFCHTNQYNAWESGKHFHSVDCSGCHAGDSAHLNSPTPALVTPKVPFEIELCGTCHKDQYNSFLTDNNGKTNYGGGLEPVQLWPKTLDVPYWNTLIDGHPFVIETYEDRSMMWNQLDAQETLRPMAESCLTCHGTKVAYYMGIVYKDRTGATKTIPAQVRTIKNTQRIWSGNFKSWQVPMVPYIVIPAGTTVSTRVNALAPPPRTFQVETVVTLPDGRIFTSFSPYPGATATGDSKNPAKRTKARNYVWAALEALALDELNIQYSETDKMYIGPNANSANAGVLCNMCHDPMATKLRVIQKASLYSIANYGINPYSNTPIPPVIAGLPPEVGPPPVYNFDQASRQDQIIAVCGQCHSEYVGGYSAVDNIDRHYFPFAKITGTNPLNPPAGQTPLSGLAKRYQDLFRMKQDWMHGAPVRPWQSADPGMPGYAPDDNADGMPDLYPINETLIKTQHPEAEMFWNSPMYVAGATCTDCHTYMDTNATGGKFMNHSFTSPFKLLMQGKNTGNTLCNRCHNPASPMIGAPGFTTDQLLDRSLVIMDDTYAQQESLQMFLMDALKIIKAKKDAGDPTAAADAAKFKKAHNTWEYYAEAENSMGFHNWDDASADMDAALKSISKVLDPKATLGPVHSLMDEGAMAANPAEGIMKNLVDLLWVASEPAAVDIVYDPLTEKPVSWRYNGLFFEVWRQDCSPTGTCGNWAMIANLSAEPFIDPTEPDAPPMVLWADENNIKMRWTYNYKILTGKNANRSVFSTVHQVVALERAMLPEFIQVATAGSEVRFHWMAAPGDTLRFIIQRSASPNFATKVQQIATPGDNYLTGWTDFTAPANKTLYYRIKADDGVAPSPWSKTFIVQTNAAAALISQQGLQQPATKK